MKIRIEIEDDLLVAARRAAKRRNTTLRALIEEGLRLVVLKHQRGEAKKLPPLVTFRGEGPTEKFKDWIWDNLRDEIYHVRGDDRLDLRAHA
jgi:hypothetical protein